MHASAHSTDPRRARGEACGRATRLSKRGAADGARLQNIARICPRSHDRYPGSDRGTPVCIPSPAVCEPRWARSRSGVSEEGRTGWPLLHEVAHRHGGAAHPAGDRRADLGPLEIQARGRERGLGDANRGGTFGLGGYAGVELLARDRPRLDQALGSRHIPGREGGGGAGPLELGLGARPIRTSWTPNAPVCLCLRRFFRDG